MTPTEALRELKLHFEKCQSTPHGQEAGGRGLACVSVLEVAVERLRSFEHAVESRLRRDDSEGGG